MARTLVYNLRRLFHSDIEIEWMYRSDEWTPTPEPGVRLVNVQDMVDTRHVDISQWALKPLALLVTRFEDAILVDADTLFLQPPERVFEKGGYQSTGTYFFRDRRLLQTHEMMVKAQEWVRAWGIEPTRNTLPIELLLGNQSFHIQESGMVAMNTRHHLISLLTTVLLNTRYRQESYSTFYGDKETYWFAMEILKTRYTFHESRPGQSGESFFPNQVCSFQMVHVDQGVWWLNGGLQDNKHAYPIRISRHVGYVVEPGEWKMENNYGCLNSTTPLMEYTSQEQEWFYQLGTFLYEQLTRRTVARKP
jgi:hypothetical protein